MEGARQGPGAYRRWFERAIGHPPYAYQEELGATATTSPSILAVPTGSGKTQAVLGAWLYRRLKGNTGPRRLVYALPMRSLVEQTRDVALEMRKRLDLDADQLPIHVLMGGEEPREGDWRRQPEADQILIGTIDMLLSRALNRGYGESRFTWPISFGLLNSDCRWVFDEVQLMGPARATSAQLDGLRAALGTVLPCETMWVSATVDPTVLQTFDRPDAGDVMSLPDADRKGGLSQRLNATKILERADLTETDPKAVPKSIAELAIERHEPGTRTLVVVNRVDTAQATFTELDKLAAPSGGATVLLHSRFRPPDRRAQMDQALAVPDGFGTIVVSTQVIEAGVDLSSRNLLTETAPFSSIVQRLGRCNRGGEYAEAHAVWLDRGEVDDSAAGRRAAAPYPPHDLSKAREALQGLEGESLSPQALEQVTVDETPDDPAVLRRRDLIDLFDTSPDLSGMDIDIAPFIREDDQPSVLACFREIDEAGNPTDNDLPDRNEIIQIPIGDLGKRRCWRLDHVDGGWIQAPGSRVPPGSTILLNAADGGYDPELGWDKSIKGAVPVITPPEQPDDDHDPEGIFTDHQGKKPLGLTQHLEDVRSETANLVAELDLQNWSDALVEAAALHDVGKAHPAFQATLREAMEGAELDVDLTETGPLWAKSGVRGKGHRQRRYIRHELASALALLDLRDALDLHNAGLTAYLVAAHHGRVRLSIRPAPGETQPDANGKPFALGIVDGDLLPAVETPIGPLNESTLDLSCMSFGGDDSWTASVIALRDAPDLGPFRLGYLEAVLRMADWRASANA